jgi:hypothetical protein
LGGVDLGLELGTSVGCLHNISRWSGADSQIHEHLSNDFGRLVSPDSRGERTV